MLVLKISYTLHANCFSLNIFSSETRQKYQGDFIPQQYSGDTEIRCLQM